VQIEEDMQALGRSVDRGHIPPPERPAPGDTNILQIHFNLVESFSLARSGTAMPASG
jgi:hypothetical protein